MLVISFILFNFVVLEHFLWWACKVGVDEEKNTPGLLQNHYRNDLLQQLVAPLSVLILAPNVLIEAVSYLDTLHHLF